MFVIDDSTHKIMTTENHFARKDIQVETLECRFKRYIGLFDFDKYDQVALGSAFRKDVIKCRENHRNPEDKPKGDMPFLETCVTAAPTGDETGIYYAVDFGGTNLRSVRVELLGNGKYESDSMSKNIRELPSPHPRGLMDPKATATELFDEISALVKAHMKKHEDLLKPRLYPVGFTFSFAMLQVDIDSAQCLRMSKGFETGSGTQDPIVSIGTDIGLLLNRAFERSNVPAEVTAILNDTTGTLISGSYSQSKDLPKCLIGLILGTGLNACYVDPEAANYGYFGSVINTELGSFGTALPRNILDHEVDDADPAGGVHLMEKMCSGAYLPELCRRAILKVFQKDAPPLCWSRMALSTEACMVMAYESGDLSLVKEIVKGQLVWDDVKDEYLPMIQQICRAVSVRAAKIIAVILSSLATFTGRLQPAMGGLTCAVDGSLYNKNPGFKIDIQEAIDNYLGQPLAKLLKFTPASDGSGLGAAILAAMPHTRRRCSFSRDPETIWQSRLQKHRHKVESGELEEESKNLNID